jgi:hypothetical protein
MLTALLLPLLAAGPVTADTAQPDPPVEIWINNDRRFVPGEAVRVHVQTQEDGYLLVLHTDPDGRVRVLFPLDPHDDNFVRGGKRYEVHGRGGREAFEASITGHGMVYAAVSKEPFRVGRYAVDGHWDYDALAPERLPREPEAEVTELVRGMGQGNFDYDVLTYDVIERVYRAADYRLPYRHWYADPLCDPYYNDYYCRPYNGSYLSVSLIFGSPYRRSYYGYYNPYYYDPFYYDPFYYRPAYVYPQRYYYNTGYAHYPYRYNRFGPRRVSPFDNYRDRRFTVQATTGYRASVPAARTVARPSGRAVQPAARPARRVVRPSVVEPRSAPTVERRPVEARRVRPAEPRRDEVAPSRPRPNIESRPSREPEARRVERQRDDAPEPERRAAPREERSASDDRAAPRAEPRRREGPSGDRGDRGDRSAGRSDGGQSSGRPSGGGGGRRR